MMHYCWICNSLLIFICVNLKLSWSEENGNWTVGSPPFILYADGYRPVGYDANKHEIVLVGGHRNPHNVISYDIENNTFKQYSNLSYSIYSQSYTQINNLLYMIINNNLCVLELDTKHFIENYHNIRLPETITDDSCIANFNNSYLVFIGGFAGGWSHNQPLNDVAIYSIDDNIWLSNIPKLQTARSRASCIVSNNKLYAFGGSTGSDLELLPTKTIEKLDLYDLIINNNANATWTYNNDTLSAEKSDTRAVIYNDNIYIIGGHEFESNIVHKAVDVLNTVTDKVSSFIPLQYKTCYTSAITVNNRIYVFGGFDDINIYDGNEQDEWQYFAFPTPEPTQSPTENPITAETTTVCGDSDNSGPGKEIQCTSNADCCDGLICRIKSGPKKGKCGKDKNQMGYTDLLQFEKSQQSQQSVNGVLNYLIGITMILIIIINIFNAIRCCYGKISIGRKGKIFHNVSDVESSNSNDTDLSVNTN